MMFLLPFLIYPVSEKPDKVEEGSEGANIIAPGSFNKEGENQDYSQQRELKDRTDQVEEGAEYLIRKNVGVAEDQSDEDNG